MRATSFSELKLTNPIQRALQAENYEAPTPIQAESIPHLLAGRDLMGCAQTGTGKTAAFALPILHCLATKKRAAIPGSPRMLVLSPTRELADQIGDSFQKYGRFVQYRQTVIYGGVSQNVQTRALRRGVHLVIATPGRLLDLMEQGYLQLNRLETFVLDEADRMMDMGFLPTLKKIIASLPDNRQSLFFSATMAKQIGELASTFLSDPVRIDVSPPASTVDKIRQRVLFVHQENKQDLLQQLLRDDVTGQALIFTRTKHRADRVARQLSRSGFRADAIHGNKSQNFRTRVLNAFRDGRFKVLVATDVAARGIDVDGISHVINFDIPVEPESYVHRIGRTGRAGAQGTAFSFCDSSESSSLRAIEKLIRSKIRVHSDHPWHVETGKPRESSSYGRTEKRQSRSRRGRKRAVR